VLEYPTLKMVLKMHLVSEDRGQRSENRGKPSKAGAVNKSMQV
jgi:hypothetical protein